MKVIDPPAHPDAAPATAVVTGAASGIGHAVVRALVARGTTVIAVDRTDLGTGPTPGPAPRTVTGDLRDHAVIDRVADAVANLPGGLDLLANVAGLYRPSRLSTSGPAVLDDLFAVNVTATVALTGAVLPALTRARGAVVNVSSTFGHRASRTGGGYGASKAAVEALTRRWAVELAPHGVRVNCVAPGPTETPILAAAGLGTEAIATQRTAERARVPLGRLGTAQEVAGWITGLARPGAMTGQVISVDGGLSCE